MFNGLIDMPWWGYVVYTLIVTHTGHDDWAERLRRAFGRGSIESYPDSLHYVDLTVFVATPIEAGAITGLNSRGRRRIIPIKSATTMTRARAKACRNA